jgi:anti-sigma factor RsiW
VTCELSQSVLHGYLDGELDLIRAEEFERHLSTCSECIAQLEAQETLWSSVQKAQLYERIPRTLSKKIKRRIAHTESDYQWSWGSILQWVAASAAIVVLMTVSYSGLKAWFADKPVEEQAALTEVLDAHVRSLQPGHLADVMSSDQHTVKPWFNGKLSYVPPVRDFAGSGFPLVGGRLDVIDGQSVAVLVYGRRKHFISVFVWPDEKPQAALPASGARNGYQWIYSRAQGMKYCAVSDISSTDLQDLEKLLQQ